MEQQHVYTVFTPTYNHAHTLHRVYDGLCQQTFKDFEWLIIDDGSTDNTQEVVESWKRSATFPIRYHWQENSRKHIAFNRGVQMARGELFVEIDHDDSYMPNALERLYFHWQNIPDAQRNAFAGVIGLCVDQFGRPVTKSFPQDVYDTDGLTLFYKDRVVGDLAGFTATKVLREFPFPELKGEHAKWVNEAVVWSRMHEKYKIRCINEVIRTFYRHEVGGSLSSSQPETIAMGQTLYHGNALSRNLNHFFDAPQLFLWHAALYSRFSLHMQKSVVEQFKNIHSAAGRMLLLLGLPIGYLIYWRDRMRANRKVRA